MNTQFLWAKSSTGSSPNYHPLVLHLLDVAASAESILEREPESTRIRMADILGLPWSEARPWLLLLIACHDLGKACPGFQLKWPALIPLTGLTVPRGTETRVNHGFVGQAALSDILCNEFGWPDKLADLAADAVGCHHGERASQRAQADALLAMPGRAGISSDQWRQVRGGIVADIYALFSPGSAPQKLKMSGPDFMLLAGLTSFADWIGSNESYFMFGTADDCNDLADWYRRRRQIANVALAAIGWSPRSPLSQTERTFAEVFGRSPRPLQSAMALSLRELDKPAVILVEAPMGEGKTEAALYAHLELQRRFQHRGLYVALPSKATGNAMFTRVHKFLLQQKSDHVLDFQLLHGAKLLNDEFEGLRTSAIHDEQKLGSIRAAEWFTHKKRALLSEYGVGTVDQSLTTILPVRHNFVRLWGLANRVVVLDEIHAYDKYTSTLIQHLVRWLQALGSSVVMLSATLSPSLRRDLARAAGSKIPTDEEAYPRLTVFREGQEVRQYHFEADLTRRLSVKLSRCGTDVASIRQALDGALTADGMGLALLNTVQRAQDLYRQFPDGTPFLSNGVRVGKTLEDGTVVLLFHARFRADERQVREEFAVDQFGERGKREGRRILIATQVAEQSLDLDFDVMITDLAPIDLVLQRAGRLWRHKRAKRAVPQPELFVTGIDEDAPPSFARPLWWGKVYREDLLLRTWSVLRGKTSIALPDDIDPMVESVYEESAPIPEFLEARLDAAILLADGEMSAQFSQANMSVVGLPGDSSWNNPSAYVLYDEDQPDVHRSLMAQTRLGPDSIIVIPIYPSDKFLATVAPARQLEREWFMRAINVSRADVVVALRKAGIPEGWAKSPLLRNSFPLLLDEDNKAILLPNVQLHEDLGLVYAAREKE